MGLGPAVAMASWPLARLHSAPSSSEPAPEGPCPRRPCEGGRDAGPPRQDPVSPGPPRLHRSNSWVGSLPRAPRPGAPTGTATSSCIERLPGARLLHRLPLLSPACGSPPSPAPPPPPSRTGALQRPEDTVGTRLLCGGCWVTSVGRGPRAGALGGRVWREGAAAGLEPWAGSVPGLPALLPLGWEQDGA